jgi:phosphoglycolate phosphatase-like HAD superfamily hydrolase
MAGGFIDGATDAFDYLLWDFDGTLFDTYPPLVHAIEQGAGRMGRERAGGADPRAARRNARPTRLTP